MEQHNQGHNSSALPQLLVNFILPIIVLTKFSGENALGATGGFVVALAFPVLYELFNITKTKKISYLSLVAIGGILVTGAIGLLGLSENWLAVRRSAVYFVGAVVIGVSAVLNRSVLTYLLRQVINLDTAREYAAAKKQERKFERLIAGGTYATAIVVAATGILSYALTRHTISAPTNSTLFNEQLASLRVQSIFVVTAPLLIGLMLILTYLITQIEKISGLPSEKLMHKQSRTK